MGGTAWLYCSWFIDDSRAAPLVLLAVLQVMTTTWEYVRACVHARVSHLKRQTLDRRPPIPPPFERSLITPSTVSSFAALSVHRPDSHYTLAIHPLPPLDTQC
ncbi:hypothetical protein J6590_002701 [Homalodisca vitripennis]|nr:hypothetical protein J6590_002701 [Homalodisca vitripennis]